MASKETFPDLVPENLQKVGTLKLGKGRFSCSQEISEIYVYIFFSKRRDFVYHEINSLSSIVAVEKSRIFLHPCAHAKQNYSALGRFITTADKKDKNAATTGE